MHALVSRLFDTEQHTKETIVVAAVVVHLMATMSLLCAMVWMG